MKQLIPHGTPRACAVFLGLAIAAACAPSAFAQVGPVNNPNELLNQGAKMAPEQGTKHRQLPPALPGAAPMGNAAPPTQVPSDMSPNAALFDAINRGDVAAARDAMSRGASLDAQNVLGLTPLQLSVDLGRNDISFLLLSYRGGGDQGSGAAPPPQTTAKAAAKPAVAPKPVRPVRTAERAPVRRVAADAPGRPPAAPQAPQLFANDGGAPVPSAGFLGFGSAAGTH